MIVNDKKNKITTDTETGAQLKLIESRIQSGHYAFQISHGDTEIRFSTEKSSELFGSELLELHYKIKNIQFIGDPIDIDYKSLIINILMGFQDRYGYRDDLVKNVDVGVNFSEDCLNKLKDWESNYN